MDALPLFVGSALMFMSRGRQREHVNNCNASSIKKVSAKTSTSAISDGDEESDTSNLTEKEAKKLAKKKIQDLRLQDRSRFRPGQCKTKVICCRSLGEYDQCIDSVVVSGDNVLAIHTQNDKADASIARMRTNVTGGSVSLFAGKDMWDIQSFMQVSDASEGKAPITVVCVNGTECFGNDLLHDSLALIRVLRGCFEPHLKAIIIKSKTLCQHSYNYMTSVGLQRRLEAEQLSVQGAMVVCTVGVGEYRSVIPNVVRRGDSVLEIGCANGTTVKAIVPYIGDASDGGRCIGIDMGRLCVETSRSYHKEMLATHSHVTFERGNGWDIAFLMQLASHFNTIFVDVGGISGVDGEMEGVAFVRQLMNAFNDKTDPVKMLRYIVVKSRCLRDHANTYKTANEVLIGPLVGKDGSTSGANNAIGNIEA